MKIPFILVTGAMSEEFAVSIIKAGTSDYILKDNLENLPMAIFNALEKIKFETALEYQQSHDVKKKTNAILEAQEYERINCQMSCLKMSTRF